MAEKCSTCEQIVKTLEGATEEVEDFDPIVLGILLIIPAVAIVSYLALNFRSFKK